MIRADRIVKGDIVLLPKGWRTVLDVWHTDGFVKVVASDCTGMWLADGVVEVARRPQPPKLAVVK